jgi:predicted AlkP superfamily pyrophosphatase or phosphodiesterase
VIASLSRSCAAGALLATLLATGCSRPEEEEPPRTEAPQSAPSVTSSTTASAAKLPSVRSPQLLVIGVDGATPEIVDRLCGEGKLPHLSRLRAEGASGELRSLEPIFSPLIWTTMATGRMPEDHGITGFTLAGGEAGLLRPSSTDQRQVPALWNLASDAGYTNAVIGWPVTWPAEKINGYLVSSYFFMPSATADLTRLLDPELEAIWPTTLGPAIAPLLKSAGDFTPRGLAKRRLGALAANPMNLSTHAKDATFLAIAGDLLAKKSPDVMMVYFQGIDVLGPQQLADV